MPAIFGQVLAQCPIMGPDTAIVKNPFVFAGDQESHTVRFFATQPFLEPRTKLTSKLRRRTRFAASTEAYSVAGRLASIWLIYNGFVLSRVIR